MQTELHELQMAAEHNVLKFVKIKNAKTKGYSLPLRFIPPPKRHLNLGTSMIE